MSLSTVLAPVFVQVALTFALLTWLGALRVRSLRAGAVQARDVALGQPNWPPRVTQIGNAFRNQLELPVLFYLVIVLALFSAHATVGLVVLSWLFVASRLLHALIHVTTNNLQRRFFTYLAGLIVLIALWLLFLVEVLVSP